MSCLTIFGCILKESLLRATTTDGLLAMFPVISTLLNAEADIPGYFSEIFFLTGRPFFGADS